MELTQKLKQLEEEVARISISKVIGESSTLVMGGLAQTSLEAAIVWIRQSHSAAGTTMPLEIYKKGPPDEAFKGRLFIKYAARGDAERGLTASRSKCTQENAHREPKNRL